MKEALDLKSKSGHPSARFGAGRARLSCSASPSRTCTGRAAPAREHGGHAGAGPGLAEPQPGFSPNVIHGDFTQRLSGAKTAQGASAVELPLYGRIAAGLPIEALRDPTDVLEVPTALLGNGEHFGLEVAGDSMIEAGILDGDYVIIVRGDTAENGQIVVAVVDENEVTLKRLRRRGNSIALEPCNVAARDAHLPR